MRIPPGFLVIGTLAVAGGGAFWFLNKDDVPSPTTNGFPSIEQTLKQQTGNRNVSGGGGATGLGQAPIQLDNQGNIALQSIAANIPQDLHGQSITVAGSTSLNDAMVVFKQAAQTVNLNVTWNPVGSGDGISQVSNTNSNVVMALSSRPLTERERSAGLMAEQIGVDIIGVAVTADSNAPQSLTTSQLSAIYNGQITDWSEVGGNPGNIDVINRPSGGTRSTFDELVGTDGNYGRSTSADSTTELLRSMDQNSIGYAAQGQVANQSKFRVIQLDRELSRPLFAVVNEGADLGSLVEALALSQTNAYQNSIQGQTSQDAKSRFGKSSLLGDQFAGISAL